MSHVHTYTRSKPDATVETCACGRFRHTEHAAPSIPGIPALERIHRPVPPYDVRHWRRMAGSKTYHYTPDWPTSGRSSCGRLDLTRAGFQALTSAIHAPYKFCRHCHRANVARGIE